MFAIRASRLGGPFTLPGGASTAQLPAENAHRRPARERFAVGDLDSLIDFRAKAPGMPYAHPTIEHFSPLFVTLGSSSNPEQPPRQVIDGYWMGLAKRSIELS